MPLSLVQGTFAWPLSVGIFITAAFFLLYWMQVRYRLFLECRRTEMDLWAAVYVLFFLLSTVLTQVPYAAFQQFYHVAAMLLLFLAGVYACEHRPQVKIYCQTLAFTGAFLSLVILLRYSSGVPKIFLPITIFHTLPAFYEMAIPICVGHALAQRDSSKRSFFLFLSFLMGAAFLSLRSPLAFVSLGTGMLVLFSLLRMRNVIRMSKKILVVLLFIMIAVWTVVFFYIARSGISFPRLPAPEVFNLFLKNFWVGAGPGVSNYAMNDYVRLWTEGGLIGSLITAILFLVAAKEAWLISIFQFSKLKASVAAGYLGAFTALAISGLKDPGLHTPAHFFLFAALTGMVFSLSRPRFYKTNHNNQIFKRLVSVMCFIFLGMSVWLGLAGFLRWQGKTEIEKGNALAAIFYLNKSIHLNPFHAEAYYWRGVAKSKSGMEDIAADDFKMAVKLNAYNPRYVWLEEEPSDPEITTAGDYYNFAEQILHSDPHHNPALEQHFEQLLHQCLEKDHSYGERVSDLLWGYYGNSKGLENFFDASDYGLPSFVKFIEMKGFWSLYRRYLLKSLGSGIALKDKEISSKIWAVPETLPLSGKLDKNGFLKIPVRFEELPVRVSVTARGVAAGGAYPQLVLGIDGEPFDSFSVNSRMSKVFETVLSGETGEHILSVGFINDYFNVFSKEDRNLWIEKVEISYPQP